MCHSSTTGKRAGVLTAPAALSARSISGVTSTTPLSVTWKRAASAARSTPICSAVRHLAAFVDDGADGSCSRGRSDIAAAPPSACRFERSSTCTSENSSDWSTTGAGDDAATRDDRIDRRAAPPVLVEHELRRRLLQLVGPDRPLLVVEIQFRRHVHQLHVGLVVGIDRADVAPVVLRARLHVGERIGEHLQLVDRGGDDVAAEIVLGSVRRAASAVSSFSSRRALNT